MRTILEGTEEQMKNLKTLFKFHPDMSLPSIATDELIRDADYGLLRK